MSADGAVTIRELGLADLDTVLAWRAEVLQEVFGADYPADPRELLQANRRYYEAALGTEHRAFLALVDGEAVGCGAVCFQRELPSPDNPTGKNAYLMNVYTRPSARHHGVAGTIVSTLIDTARAEGAGKIYLEATEEGEPLYKSLGFAPLKGMMKLH